MSISPDKLTWPRLTAFSAPAMPLAQALFVLRVLYCGLPIPLLVVTIALLWNFPLDPRRVGVMQRRIAARRSRSALRPVAQMAMSGRS